MSSSKNTAMVLGVTGVTASSRSASTAWSRPRSDCRASRTRRCTWRLYAGWASTRRAPWSSRTLSGVEAGRRGGFGLVIGVARLGQAKALRKAGADVVVDDLAEVGVAA